MPDTNRQWLLTDRPHGQPTLDAFELVEEPVPEPGPKEVLLKTLWMSVDPYMRGRMRATDSYADYWELDEPMRCHLVGEVVESKHPDWEPGDIATERLQWAEYNVVDGHDLDRIDPDLAPLSTFVGVLGMPGRTAYFGLLEVGEPKPGETVVVSGAAGAVGSVVGQIAKINGCRVVGTAGSDEKVDWLTDELGFDDAINYKETDDYVAALEAACPDGIDVYFDNVGGAITDAVFEHLNEFARVVICGQIALYNLEEQPTGPRKFRMVNTHRLRIQGFIVGDFSNRNEEAMARLGGWVTNGDIQYRETVTEGFERAPEALIGLFEGENIGKQVVHVADVED